jgi:hypothetical protein
MPAHHAATLTTKGNAMKTSTTRKPLLPTAFAAGLAVTVTIALPQLASAGSPTPPAVPANIQVPPGNKPFFEGHAVGTQNYVCLTSGADAAGRPRFAWTLFTPQATLLDDEGREVTTHYFSANPLEPGSSVLANGAIRATWQHSADTSTVWGKVAPGDASSDPAFVKPGAIAWLRLTAVGARNGPTGGNTLTGTTFVQRVNTSGGAAPSVGCTTSSEVGNQAFVPYTADYVFYAQR